MTESEIFQSITGSGSADFALLPPILDQHGHWCLTGGLAVNCYVEPVFELDADIVVVASELQSIKEALSNAGFRIDEFPHSINAMMPGSDLRIQLTTDLRYQTFLSDRVKRGVRRRYPLHQLRMSSAEKFGLGRTRSVVPQRERKTSWI